MAGPPTLREFLFLSGQTRGQTLSETAPLHAVDEHNLVGATNTIGGREQLEAVGIPHRISQSDMTHTGHCCASQILKRRCACKLKPNCTVFILASGPAVLVNQMLVRHALVQGRWYTESPRCVVRRFDEAPTGQKVVGPHRGAQANSSDPNWLVFDGRVDIMQMLPAKSTPLETYGSDGLNPFHAAMLHRHFAAIKAVARNCTRTDTYVQRQTPLYVAEEPSHGTFKRPVQSCVRVETTDNSLRFPCVRLCRKTIWSIKAGNWRGELA
jgi:hypothetical protein